MQATLLTTRWRVVAAGVILAALYAAVAWASLRVFATLNASASPVWPPSGIALAGLLLGGRRLWPAIWVGAWATNFFTAASASVAAAIATGNTLEALVASTIILRLGGGDRTFYSVRHVATFMVAGITAPLVSASIGVGSLWWAGAITSASLSTVWFTWWLGDVAGTTIVAPLVLLFAWNGYSRLGGRVEGLGLGAATLASSVLVFIPVSWFAASQTPLAFVPLPLVVWAALRFGSRGAAVTTAVVASIASVGTLRGFGPFGDLAPNTALLFLQVFALVVAVTGLSLGAVVRERRDAEMESDKARASERRFFDMVESAPDATIMVDGQGRIAVANAQAERIFGWAREDLIGRPVEVLVPARFASRHVGQRGGYMAAPVPRPMGVGRELLARRADGSEFPVEISLSPIGTGDKALVAASVRDVSDRKRREAEIETVRRQAAMSERLAAVGTMVSGVGHEVRTPLTYINTNLTLVQMQMDRLEKAQVTPEQARVEIARLLAKAREGVTRIDRIVQQLRGFAKAELRIEECDLRAVVAEAVELFRSVRRGQVHVEAELTPVDDFALDKGQIQQVIINLLNNGADAIQGHGTLHVRLRPLPGGAEILVEDEGPGIPPAVQRHLFDPFFTTKVEGTGLGLSISRRILEAHGGALRYRTGDEGTTFIMALPRVAAPPVQKVPA